MRRHAFPLMVVCAVLLTASVTFAQTDILKSAVDPYEQPTQRRLFLQAAGVDSELSSEEFAAEQKKEKGLAKSYDKWATVTIFDKNKNGSMDWFEFDAYRRDLRLAVLGVYDKDNNRKLTGPEREAAAKDLAAGKLPKLNVPRTPRPRSSGSSDAPPRPRGDAPRGNDRGDRGNNDPRARFEELRAEMLKKHDKDGDGELTGDERDAARREIGQIMRQRYIDQYDKNGDGEVDREEREAAREAQRERWRQSMLERYDKNKDGEIDEDERRAAREAQVQAFLLRRFDEDKDGKLNETEQAAADKAREEYRQRSEERRKEFMERFDKNKNGEIDEEEREAIREAFRGRGRGRGGPDGDRRRGGDRDRGDNDSEPRRDRSF